MHPETNHLVDFSKKDEKTINEYLAEQFEVVPLELLMAARHKLAGKDEAHVSFNSGGKLSKWAANRRKEIREENKDGT